MRRYYCNRCNAEITTTSHGRTEADTYPSSDRIQHLPLYNMDSDSGGTIRAEWDLCKSCYKAFQAWLRG